MTPNPPSNSDGSALPPRHRPNKGNLAKDTTETDLWAFDDLDPTDEPPAEVIPPAEPSLPEPKTSGRPAKDSVSAKASTAKEHIRVNVNKPKARPQSEGGQPGAAKPGEEFDDLAHWEDSTAALEPAESVEPAVLVPKAGVSPGEFQQPSLASPASKGDDADEFSPVVREGATPVSLRPHLSLSKVERVGLIALVVILLLGAATLVVFSLNRLPTESARAATHDFPLKGGYVTVKSSASYWRQPILEGANPDTFRRGTILLPVLMLEIADGTAGLRVIFRNQDGESIGDIVTRSVQGGRKFEIPATAGFDDVGMHAAYRTGESKPWTVEVLEAPSADSPNDAFKKLFEMNISTDRR